MVGVGHHLSLLATIQASPSALLSLSSLRSESLATLNQGVWEVLKMSWRLKPASVALSLRSIKLDCINHSKTLKLFILIFIKFLVPVLVNRRPKRMHSGTTFNVYIYYAVTSNLNYKITRLLNVTAVFASKYDSTRPLSDPMVCLIMHYLSLMSRNGLVTDW